MGGNGRASGPATLARPATGTPPPPPDPPEAIDWRARQFVIADLDDAYTPWLDSLAADESKALLFYQSWGYGAINGALRRYEGLPPRDTATGVADSFRSEDVAALDAVIARTPTPQPLTVWRGFKRTLAPAQAQALVGKNLVDHGFVSTTLSLYTAESFTQDEALPRNLGTIYRIDVPAGSRAAWIDRHRSRGEDELLLPRNSRFRVTAVTTRPHGEQGGRPVVVIHLTALPPKEPIA